MLTLLQGRNHQKQKKKAAEELYVPRLYSVLSNVIKLGNEARFETEGSREGGEERMLSKHKLRAETKFAEAQKSIT